MRPDVRLDEPTWIRDAVAHAVFAELLIDCEDRTLRAALVGMLREMERK
jgi:hypothetical protein